LRFTFDDASVLTERAKPSGAEESMSARLLISGAGTPASNNLIRSLRAGDPSLRIAAFHSDRFVLRRSDADRRYLVPLAGHPAYRSALRRIIGAERPDLLIPTSDGDVRALSRLRAKIPCLLFIPRHATIEACQDKYELSVRLRKRGIPSPLTYPVTSLARLGSLFRRLPARPRVWCRMRTGSGSMGAIPVTRPEQAGSWIRHWQAMRRVRVDAFTLSEYLPGRDFGCQSLWKDGTLILIKTYERLSYLGMGGNPGQVSSVATLAKTVREPRVVDICARAVRALDPGASGVFSVDLKENADGVPCITDVNVGRFSSATAVYDQTGKHNMAITYVHLALGEPVDLREEYDVAEDYYVLRDVDMPPAVFHADDFFDGIEEARA
jgi:carbamoyl-phosphate synthase large subunit